jgi:hypothetical protein
VRDVVARVNILPPLTICPLLLVALVDGMSRILAITTGIIARVEAAVGAVVSLTATIESTTISTSTGSSSKTTTKATTVESTETTTIAASKASFAIAVTILAILCAEIRDVGVCDRCRILRGLVGENFDSGEEIRDRHGTKLVADRLMKGTPFFAERAEKSKVDFEIGHWLDGRRTMVVDLLLKLDKAIDMVGHGRGGILDETIEGCLGFAAFDIRDMAVFFCE